MVISTDDVHIISHYNPASFKLANCSNVVVHNIGILDYVEMYVAATTAGNDNNLLETNFDKNAIENILKIWRS